MVAFFLCSSFFAGPILANKNTTFSFIANLFKISRMRDCKNNLVDNFEHKTIPQN